MRLAGGIRRDVARRTPPTTVSALAVAAAVGSLLLTACGAVPTSTADAVDSSLQTPPAVGGAEAAAGGRVPTSSQTATTDPAPRATTGSTTTAAVPAPTGAVASTVPRGLRPVRVSIPAIGVDAAMSDLGIAGDGTIEVPSNPGRAGWLDTTPAPGQQGPAVVAGHVDSTTGPAVFYRLRTLSTGDLVVITRRDGSTVRFTVDGVRSYPQRAFPTAEVYGPVPGPVLRLITCGGDYVKAAGGYQDNVVVYAS